MKTFKSFLGDRLEEVAKPKAKGEKDFFDAHKVTVSDPEEQGSNSAKVATKERSGKRPADKPPVTEEDLSYKAIKAKAKNEEHEILLTALYDDLHESNREFFLQKLDEDYDRLIEFAQSVTEE
jgi:hypothetical protein